MEVAFGDYKCTQRWKNCDCKIRWEILAEGDRKLRALSPSRSWISFRLFQNRRFRRKADQRNSLQKSSILDSGTMPSPKSHRRGQEEKSRRGKGWPEKSSSFNGNNYATTASIQLRRRKTLPNLYSFRNPGETMFSEAGPKPTRLLLNVTIQGSVGQVQVLMPPETTVSDLVTAALRQYLKEGRRPILPTTETSGFRLHYSQFSLESLGRDEKLVTLGSRNFFLCRETQAQNGGGSETTTASGSCSKELEEAKKPDGFNWSRFMEFTL